MSHQQQILDLYAIENSRLGAELLTPQAQQDTGLPMEHVPDIIYIDARARGLPLTHSIASNLSDVLQEVIHDVGNLQAPKDFTLAKQRWLLTTGPKKWLHVASSDTKHCTLQTDFVTNAPYDCSYCALPLRLAKHPFLSITTNIESALADLGVRCAKEEHKQYTLSCGHLGDALAVDHMIGLCPQVITFAGDTPNLQLELRTRSTQLSHLYNLEHRCHTTIVMHIAPESFIENEERDTPPLHERFAAAKSLAEHGYNIAFAINPVCEYPNWQSDYDVLINQMLTYVPHNKLRFLEFSCFHYPRGLSATANEKFPKSRIFFGELVPVNGCYRYLRHVRAEMYQYLKTAVARKVQHLPIRITNEHGGLGTQ